MLSGCDDEFLGVVEVGGDVGGVVDGLEGLEVVARGRFGRPRKLVGD